MSVDAAPPDPDSDRVGAAALEWTEAGEPRSTRFGDVYFSRDDGLAEARAVFLQGCGLPEAWSDGARRDFTIAELGLGTGLNILAVLDLWRRARPTGARLNLFSVEAFPMTADEARRALSAWPELADPARVLLDRWPVWTPGFHRLDLPEFDAVLDVAVGDAAWALSQWSGRADAWFLDGFSPALNPEMWSEAVLDGVAARSAPGARLATFTVAGAVRRGLAARGFAVDKRPGHGRKRERLEARLPDPAPVLTAAAPPTVAVVGAGVAGASVARALQALGWAPLVLDQDQPGSGASGFPVALVTPRLDAGDVVVAGLHAQALDRARVLYGRIPGAVVTPGVLQLEAAPRDAARFGRIAAQPIWPPETMQVLDADAAADRLGEPASSGGLMMAGALTVRPAAILEDFLNGLDVRRGAVARIEPSALGWRTLDADGDVLSDTSVLVLTAGWGLADLLPEAGLRSVRGQADWVEIESQERPGAVAWGGYVAPTPDGLLFGATHDRDQTEVDVRDADSVRNRAALAARLPALASILAGRPGAARAAVRAVTPDRLPLCGAAPNRPGLFLLGGLGSRGFCLSPLLGEHLAARIAGRPSPLPVAFGARLAPERQACQPARPSAQNRDGAIS